ncbi:Intracellular protein transport protein USO1 isoform 2 [Gossypium australe]|uniref:Intracellular protein transport protein USO1 isoform 2 n=1 Tax=Gossypium australe TaxID=47621 RepID=A0A5B6VHD5_9ROSI|nr:Intracellular protein transport protein USO1 isoform 2 [Gossypium australe]
MNTRGGQVSRGQKSRSFQGEGLNWILIAGGALLSTLSIRLGYKLKQALDTKQQHDSSTRSKGIGSSDRRRSSGCRLHSNMYSFTQEDDWCFNCISGAESIGGKHPPNGHMPPSSEVALPLVTVPTSDFNKDNGVIKREVIQKLRQQLKRRDDMILEMQDQITELQNSLNAQISHSSHLQSQLDVANRDLFDSEREIQRLRKVIADHCVVRVNTNDKTSTVTALAPDIKKGHANGYLGIETNLDSPEKGRGDDERIGMLRSEVEELKEVIEGKQYLLQSYKEQKMELSMKIKELQQRLDYQLPSIL